MSLPTLAQVDELGTLVAKSAPARFEDMNGHVNVRGHYDLHMDGAEIAFEQTLGIDEAYVARVNQSSFSLAHHVQFHHEVLVGHEVSLHLRLLGRGPKTIHAVTILANRTTDQIASTVEFVEVYVDLATRRSAPIAADVAARIDPVLAQHQALSWSLPPSQQLGTSRN